MQQTKPIKTPVIVLALSLILSWPNWTQAETRGQCEAIMLPTKSIATEHPSDQFSGEGPSNQLFSRERVLMGLQALNRAGFILDPTNLIRSSHHGEVNSVLSGAVGFETTAAQLVRATEIYLDSDYTTALKKAGFTSRTLWSRERVISGLSALHKAGYAVKAGFLASSKDEGPKQIATAAVGFNVTLKMLYHMSLELFPDGGLYEALKFVDEGNKGPPNSVQPWTVEKAIRGLQALARAGFYPNRSFLTESKDPVAVDILSKEVGFQTTLSSLYNQTLRLNNRDFNGALRVADIGEPPTPKPLSENQPPAKSSFEIARTRAVLNPHMKWNKERVVRGLQVLLQSGFKPSYRWLSRSTDVNATRILSDAVGFKTTLRTLLRNARLFHGSLDEALSVADLLFVKHDRSPQWTKEEVRLALQALYDAGYDPTPGFLQKTKDPETKNIISDVVGFSTSPASLYEHITHLYSGKVYAALVDAGLPADELMTRLRRHIDPFALVPHQIEESSDGRSLLKYIGEPPRNPLQHLLSQEALDLALATMPIELWPLGEEVIDVIISLELGRTGTLDANKIHEQILRDGNHQAKLSDVELIWRSMANNIEFRNYLRR